MDETKSSLVAFLIRWLKPSYDENALLMMSVTCLALLYTDDNLTGQIQALFSDEDQPVLYFLIWGGMIFLGFALSLVRLFTPWRTTPTEKYLMAIFALAVNGIAGVLCGIELAENFQGWQVMFPVWNIICGLLLIYLLGLGPEDCVTDEPLDRKELAYSLPILTALFIICHEMMQLSWAMTFSICIAYSTSVDHIFHGLMRTLKALANEKRGPTRPHTVREARSGGVNHDKLRGGHRAGCG